MALTGEADLYVTHPEFADVCVRELGGRARQAPAPGLVAMPRSSLRDPCFARQVLPLAHPLAGRSADDLLAAVFASLHEEREEQVLDGRALVHLGALEPARGPRGAPRSVAHEGELQRFAEAFAQKKAGRARKLGIEAHPGPPEALLQVLLVRPWEAFTSWTAPPGPDPLLAWPAAFPLGRAAVQDRPAPSSAFRKLVDALAWMGAKPGEHDVVLDLGAAPGGWTWVALEHGAHVVAYDRARLDPRLEDHPRLTHRRRDAFGDDVPFADATWLLCDVIDKPGRALELVERGLEARLAGMVITAKLTRPVDVTVLREAAHAVAHAPGYAGRVKNLPHNKCEVTLMLRRGAERRG